MDNRFFPNYPSYLITSRFGIRTLKGVTKMHNGIDLVATLDGKTGQVDKIKAHTGGIVCGVGYDNSRGNFVKIRVAEDTVMVYYHLRDRSTLEVGDTVKTGEIIGVMGKTGNSTGCHLHWGIKVGNSWIDPEPYLDKDYPVEEPIATGTVTASALRIRADAGTEYDTLGLLNRGEKVKICRTEANGDRVWGRISGGWICLTGYVELEMETFTLEMRVLCLGCEGEDVRALQALLVGLGYPIVVNGVYDAKTENAVACYQEENGLTENGIADRKTRAHLAGLKSS